jgi:hypothetical protein
VTGQDGGVILIVGAAAYYLVRKFLLPPKAKSQPVAFVSIQQLKAKSRSHSHAAEQRVEVGDERRAP